jgi:hypothetical protein
VTPPRPDERTDDDQQPHHGAEGEPATEGMVDEEAEETMPASDPPANY